MLFCPSGDKSVFVVKLLSFFLHCLYVVVGLLRVIVATFLVFFPMNYGSGGHKTVVVVVVHFSSIS